MTKDTLLSIPTSTFGYFQILNKLRLYISMRTNAILAEPLKFIARATTMGEKKLVIYVPLEFHKEILKRWGKKQLKITIEDAV